MSSAQIRVIRGFKFGQNEVKEELPIEDGAMAVIDEEIPDESTDLELTFTLDVSECSAIVILSDQALTIETNSGSEADDTIPLEADKQVDWIEADGATRRPFTTDVTSLFITNASGAAARLRIYCPYDPTP